MVDFRKGCSEVLLSYYAAECLDIMYCILKYYFQESQDLDDSLNWDEDEERREKERKKKMMERKIRQEKLDEEKRRAYLKGETETMLESVSS